MPENVASYSMRGMNDEELVLKCFRPLLADYKEVSAANGDVSRFFRRLTSNQQALFISYSYLVHVLESAVETYWWSAYFMAQGRWESLRAKTIALGAPAFDALLSDIETELGRRGHPKSLTEIHAVQREDLDGDDALRKFFADAYERLTAVAADNLIARLAKVIRQSPDDFRMQR
ncbi:hypothetical protein ACFFSY_21210 [Paenibacillus aurantiacus]|uniref:DUF4375 domain-containing protein n=1 Tax=Paenibacillus aurantiacus TaxID=1936118 RepID=A0ABV5KTE5_9BACL